MAQGQTLIDTINIAKAQIRGAILHTDQLKIGGGNGPVHHFFAQQPNRLLL